MQVSTSKKRNAKIHFCQITLIRFLIPTNIEKKTIKSIPAEFLWRKIEKNGYNLNISRYVSTTPEEEIVDVEVVRQELEKIEEDIRKAKARHNEFLKELGLKQLP